MFKFRIPYSGLGALIVAAAGYAPLIVGCVGLGLELLMLAIILWRLRSSSEFDYDSFYGQILFQYLNDDEVNIMTIINYVGLRVVGYILLIFSFWYFIPSVVFVLGTSFHYSPTKKGSI